MMVVENGAVRWPSGALVEVSEADNYAEARGWTDWATLEGPRKSAAVLDASTYIRASYAPPSHADEGTEAAIRGAVIEAARLSLTGPLLGGVEAGKQVKKSVKAGSVQVEYGEAGAADLNKARLALVVAMLRSAGAYAIGTGINVRLAKS